MQSLRAARARFAVFQAERMLFQMALSATHGIIFTSSAACVFAATVSTAQAQQTQFLFFA